MGLTCGGDSDGNAHDSKYGVAIDVAAVDLTGKGTFTEFEKSVKIADGSTFPVPSLPGGRTAATCIGAQCLAVMHDGDGLVLAVSVIGVGAPDEQTAVTYLDMLGPQVLRTLAALS